MFYTALQVTAREGIGEFIDQYEDKNGDTWVETRINGRLYTYLLDEIELTEITKTWIPERRSIEENQFWAAQQSEDPHAVYYYCYPVA